MSASIKTELDKKIEHVTWQMNRETDKMVEKMQGLEETVEEQKKDLQHLITHQATMLRQDFADIHQKYAESMKASLAKHINNVHQELDDMHEFTEGLEKKMKDRDRLIEKNEEKMFATWRSMEKIGGNEHKIEKVRDSLDKPAGVEPGQEQRAQRKGGPHLRPHRARGEAGCYAYQRDEAVGREDQHDGPKAGCRAPGALEEPGIHEGGG